MALHPEGMSEQIALVVDTERRLLVAPWENGRGSRFVTVAPQHRDRGGEWRLSHSGLILSPDTARELGPALAAVAAGIDAAPEDPAPSDHDRELSRMP